MRKTFLEAASKAEPFSSLYAAGATPAVVKEALIRLLQPFVVDKGLLAEHAVGYLSGEAITIAKLSARPQWRRNLQTCLGFRDAAIGRDVQRTVDVMTHFEPAISEAQKTYTHLVLFELPKADLDLDEFAFEILRNLGLLIESGLQPYLKELYALILVAKGGPVDLSAVTAQDLGRTCEALDTHIQDPAFLTPPPWNVRLNQWRNIAQHSDFVVEQSSIKVTYGRSTPRHGQTLSREDLLDVAHEVVSRVGALRCSRVLASLNHMSTLGSLLPSATPPPYVTATSLTAAFATQGFRLTELSVSNTDLNASLEDATSHPQLERAIHCSQFVATFASHYPGLSICLRYYSDGRHRWTFEAAADDLGRVMAMSEPLEGLAEVVTFKREP
jgi:hypothetical protein